MSCWSQIKESRNYEILKKSVELRYIKRNAIIVGAITAIALLLLVIALCRVDQVSGRSSVRLMTGVLMMVLLLLPCTGYYIYRIFEIFFHIDRYTFTQTMLDHPHRGNKNSMYFTVILRDRYGKEFTADTHSIFGFGAEPMFEEYINKKALIAYNEQTGLVIVIGRLPEADR